MATESSFSIPIIMLDASTIDSHNPPAAPDMKSNCEHVSMELCGQTEDCGKDSDEYAKQINDELTKAVKNMFTQKKNQQPSRKQASANICGNCRIVVDSDSFYFHISRCKPNY
ncbi:hypothetical protein H4R99_004748 [Coemansia sp. RSA 1722]|nr:hypothetical protein H4R99_004748 [Coemansia sp. RSA 1722]